MNDGPLGGAGVLITRPAKQAGGLQDAVEAAGGRPILFPAIDIVPRPATKIENEFRGLPRADIVIFVSANAVHYGLPHLSAGPRRIAAVGPATTGALEAAGSRADIIPEGGTDSEHLLATESLHHVAGLNITIVRGGPGRELLADTLCKRGANVEYLSAYERKTHAPTSTELTDVDAACREGLMQAVMVMSVASLESLLEILPTRCQGQLQKYRLVAPSMRVLQTALKRIPGIDGVLSSGPGADDMTEALVASLQRESESNNG